MYINAGAPDSGYSAKGTAIRKLGVYKACFVLAGRQDAEAMAKYRSRDTNTGNSNVLLSSDFTRYNYSSSRFVEQRNLRWRARVEVVGYGWREMCTRLPQYDLLAINISRSREYAIYTADLLYLLFELN